MKSIQKGREPNSLLEHRAAQTQPYSRNVFDDFAHKGEAPRKRGVERMPVARTRTSLLLLYEKDCAEHDED